MLLSGCASTGVSSKQIEDLRIKAEQGNPASQFQLGVAYDQSQGVTRNLSEAASWYRKAADKGYAVAQNSLGSLYQYGEGIPQDNKEAMLWYKKAAEQDYGEAYTNLGYMYDGGLGVEQDKQKAVRLYHKGAEKSSLNAMLNLGISYWKGEGVSSDLVQAYMWLNLARFYTQRSTNMQLKWRVRGVLDEVKKQMTEDQINKAKELTRKWNIAHRTK